MQCGNDCPAWKRDLPLGICGKLMQDSGYSLVRLHWETDLGTLDHFVFGRCIRRQLALDEVRKSNFLPMIAAQQIVDTCHRLNAALECVDEVRHRALARASTPTTRVGR